MTIIETEARPLAETLGKYLSNYKDNGLKGIESQYPYKLTQINPMITSKYIEFTIGQPHESILEPWDLASDLDESCIKSLKKALNKIRGIKEPEPEAVVNTSSAWYHQPDM